MWTWDMHKELFTLPIIGWPIAWYGVLFAFGFWVAYQIAFWGYLKQLPKTIGEADILDQSALFDSVKKGYLPLVKLRETKIDAVLDVLNRMDRQNLEKRFSWLVKRKVRARAFCEKLSIYVIIGTLIGARLGHLLFYEPLAELIKDPLVILRLREGGLASHGGVLGVFIALVLFSRKMHFSVPKLISLLAIPACVAGAFIRLGNFVNQEILGKVTSVPWAVIFAHPADGSSPALRHPVVLYEALVYFGLALFLTRVKAKGAWMFALLFSMRFVIEFFKEEQCVWMGYDAYLTMGQWLSIPCILAGVIWLVMEWRGAQKRLVHA